MHLWLYSQTWGHVTSKSQVLRFAFYPRPPGGGRHPTWPYPENLFHISIHALRVEGDPALFRLPISFPNFYPRPPGGGRPRRRTWLSAHCPFLSALPVKRYRRSISIHALRVEGDPALFRLPISFPNFYPRPPGGGRRPRTRAAVYKDLFLSTPSGWRATRLRNSHITDRIYFYPRPPGGGRPYNVRAPSHTSVFLSTPSGWRATGLGAR